MAEATRTRDASDAYLQTVANPFGAATAHSAVGDASRNPAFLAMLAYKAVSFQACEHKGCNLMVSGQVSGQFCQ